MQRKGFFRHKAKKYIQEEPHNKLVRFPYILPRMNLSPASCSSAELVSVLVHHLQISKNKTIFTNCRKMRPRS